MLSLYLILMTAVFYECRGRTPVLMSCPAGLYFDSRINVCNWPEYADCHVKTTTTTTIASPTTTETTTNSTTTTASPTTTQTPGNSTSTTTTSSRIKRSADIDVVCH